MPDNIFSIKNLSYGYEKKTEVIHKISADIAAHKITALIGPNGCGKTTLFGLLTKTFKPWAGEISFDGKSIAEYDKKEFARRISVVHQYNTVPEDLTVRNLVALGRTPYHNSLFSHEGKADKDIIEEAMEFTQVSEFRDRQVRELSGGQMQRVWLALALAQSREVLLLDEITTYLDIRYQYEIMNLIRELNRKYSTTVVMVLHDINETIQFSDDTIIMKSGEIVCGGSTAEIITEQVIKDTYEIETKIVRVGEGKVCIFDSG